MKSVFEKIIERLEERTSFLSDCTKYGNKDAEQQNKSYSTMMMYEVSDLVDDLIEIVKQEAEQYNNGWIPCSVVDHPEHSHDCEVTMINNNNYTREIAFFSCTGRWMRSIDLAEITVVAWKEPSEPYKPKGE